MQKDREQYLENKSLCGHQKMGIKQSVCQCAPGPHDLLLIVRVDSKFNELHRKAVVEHLSTVVVFNIG